MNQFQKRWLFELASRIYMKDLHNAHVYEYAKLMSLWTTPPKVSPMILVTTP